MSAYSPLKRHQETRSYHSGLTATLSLAALCSDRQTIYSMEELNLTPIEEGTSMKGFALAIVFVLITGCVASLSARKESFEPGAILVLPPRDVVQAGVPHPVGVGSGKQLMQVIISGVNQSSDFKAISTRSKKFDYRSVADVDGAIQEAKDLNADYVLITVLGEFRDAAPLTFRLDFVTLQSAKLFSVPGGNIVWQTTEPFVLTGSGYGHHYVIIDDIGQSIVKSISE